MHDFSARHCGVLGVGAGGVERYARVAVVVSYDIVFEHVTLDFLSRNVWQHHSVDFHTRAQLLPTALFHFPAKCGVLDDVFLGVRQFVFGKYGAHAVAPSANCFQVGCDLGFFHKSS